jgi:hypothetical protein
MLILVHGITVADNDVHRVLPRKFAQAVILLTRIQEVSHSNLRRDAGHPDSFSWLSQSLQANAGILTIK